MIEQVWADLKWLAFYAQYCAGNNIDKPFCGDFRFWAVGAAAGIAALVVAIFAWRIARTLSQSYGNWRYRKALAAVADAETMEKYKWTGDRIPDVHESSEELAAKIRNAVKAGRSSPGEKA
jgi:hypothetical protein